MGAARQPGEVYGVRHVDPLARGPTDRFLSVLSVSLPVSGSPPSCAGLPRLVRRPVGTDSVCLSCKATPGTTGRRLLLQQLQQRTIRPALGKMRWPAALRWRCRLARAVTLGAAGARSVPTSRLDEACGSRIEGRKPMQLVGQSLQHTRRKNSNAAD